MMKHVYCLIFSILLYELYIDSSLEAYEQYSLYKLYDINTYEGQDEQNTSSTFLKFETYKDDINNILWDKEVLDESTKPKQTTQFNTHYFKKLDINQSEKKYTIRQCMYDLASQYKIKNSSNTSGFIEDRLYGRQLLRVGIMTSQKNKSMSLLNKHQSKAFYNFIVPKLTQLYNFSVQKIGKFLYIINMVENYNEFIRRYSIKNNSKHVPGLYQKNAGDSNTQNEQPET